VLPQRKGKKRIEKERKEKEMKEKETEGNRKKEKVE
jgi:hypothetical protein